MPRRFATLFAVFALAAPASTARAQSQTEQLARAGITNLMAQKFPEAEAAFRKLYEAEPDKIRGLMGVVEVYMAQGKEDDAQRLLDAEILKPPARPDLLVFAGDTAMRTKNYDKAVVRFQQAIEAIDFKSEGTFYVHRAATTGNSLADSVNALIGPDATPKGAAGVYLRLCEAWRRKGDDPSALDAIRHAKELAPRDSAVLWYFATLLDSGGQKKEALEAYRSVVEIDPKNALALNNAAYLMAETGGDLYEALRYAQRAELLEPKISQIADTVGWVKLKIGWTDDAITTFSGLVASEPGNPSFRAHLRVALEKTGAHSPKLDALIAELKKDPSPESDPLIVALLQELGRKDQRPK